MPAVVHDRDGHFDVIVLGAGISGSTIGAILARNGVSVLLLDAATHPRFAVGESTTPHNLFWFRLLARRYGVPELEYLTNYESCLSEIGPSFGIKRHFGFMLHRPGEEPDPRAVHQIGTTSSGVRTSHLFRQVSDAYLFHTAIRYGCLARQGYRIAEVEITEDHVAVAGRDGSRYTARYVVDASGYRSVLATRLGLREEPSRLRHHSRSMFTHMVDVRTTDECLRTPVGELPPVPWFQGTMHHIIPRGWFWVIPFNNEPRSRNPLVSVGLTLDERVHPRHAGVTPADEFAQHAGRYPAIERIFADARAVREWVSTDRLQYSSHRTIGPRWCLMSHAAGFVDPFLSRGISNTAEVINALSWRLLAAVGDDDFATERFAYVERLEQGLLDFNDAMVNASFISFDNYELWNAVCRVWAYGDIPANIRLDRVREAFDATGDPAVFADLERSDNIGLWWPDSPSYRGLFDEMVRLCDEVDAGRLDADTAGRTLMDRIDTAECFAPDLGFRDRAIRFINLTPEQINRFAQWLAAASDTRIPATGGYAAAGVVAATG